MKPAQLRTVVARLLEGEGARTETAGSHLLQITAPPKLAERLGPSRLVLAFSPSGLKEDPSSELATVGNPVFDRILELALESGRTGERFAQAPRRRRKAPDPASAQHGTYGPPTAWYTPLYHFLFKLEYSMEEIPDELEVVQVDGLTLDTPPQQHDLVEQWDALAETPEEGRQRLPAFPVPDAVTRAALSALERRLKKRVARLRKVSEAQLGRETASIKNYYEQLIHEARNVGRRWSSSADERGERIQLLQLDWKRRIEEAQEFWRPLLTVHLSAVGVVQVPRLRFDQQGAAGRRRAQGAPLWYCEQEGNFLKPPTSGEQAAGRVAGR